MSDYFSVLSLESRLDRDAIPRLARLACLELHRVEWLRGYLSVDGVRLLAWYRARDAESVRLVLRQQGTAAEVWPADVTGGVDADDVDRDCVVVEFETRPAGLDAADLGNCRTFTGKHGTRCVCVVDGSDTSAVTARLQSAGLGPTAVWRAAVLDPQPKLFQEPASAPFRPATREMHAATPNADDAYDAVIIGAGIAGIAMLERLVRMGLNVRVYEAASDVGGVWHWNRYPGARVDSETYTYALSFSDELVREWQWQELFAAQPEIARYLRHIVDRFDLRRHIRFDTRVEGATFDAASNRWSIVSDAGERVRTRYLIAATGSLSAPQLPDYPGMDRFAGASYHTAHWPEGGVDLAGKRVGVIGTGATGVQVIQTIASEVAHLTVFQRTPNYCVPQRNRPLTDAERRTIVDDWPDILAACRQSYAGFMYDFDPRSGLAVTPEEREATFEALWQRSGLAFWLANFGDLVMNDEVNAHASEFVRRKICERVNDPEIARKLLPNHPIGSKRVPAENGYYEVFNRANVRLVDLRETPIERITPTGIETSAGHHPLDVIVYATGFDAGTGALTRIAIRGEDGRTLAEKWRDGPKTFLGLLAAGFPNFFMLNGPHNAAALCNVGRCVEQNVDWIARCIEHVRSQQRTRIAPTAAAEEEWTRHVHDVADASLLAKMTESWFYGANTPGKARKINIYAGGAREYREHCEAVASGGYPGLTIA